MRNKLKVILLSILPGIFLLGFNIGTGSVTSMAKAGATYGMSLLWALLLSCLITYFLIVSYGRFTLITGKTAIEAFRKHIHPVVGIFFVIALGIEVTAGVISVMGITTDVVHVWSQEFIEGGLNKIGIALFFILLVCFVLWNGSSQLFERALAVVVAIMAAAFIMNNFIAFPPVKEVVRGMLPTKPVNTADNAFLVTASMVGTTIFSGIFIIRTSLVKEAGWTIKDLKLEKRDAFISAMLMFILSASVMAAAADTMYLKNIGLNEASQMIQLLEPIAGSASVNLFVVGIVAAGVSSLFPNIVLTPWLISDYKEVKKDMTTPVFRGLALTIAATGLIVPVFEANPIVIVLVSQALSALLLPGTVFCILYLSNRKDLMKDYKNKWGANILLILIFLFSLYISVLGFIGLAEQIFNYKM